MDFTNPITLLIIALGVAVVILAGYALYLNKRKGVAKPDLARQVALKVSDDADAFRDSVFTLIREYAAKLPEPTLKASYFDTDDFLMDVGRLPASFASAVTLDGKVKRNGNMPSIEYKTAENGNVNAVTENK